MSILIDIIESAVAKMRTSYGISTITDNADNTYTITIITNTNNKLFADLQENEIITISGAVGFNENFEISNLNELNKTFDIKLGAGVTIPGSFGTAKKNAPYYDAEYVSEIGKVLTLNNQTVKGQKMKFPLIYLSTDFSEKVNNNIKIIDNVIMYIINTSELNRDTKWRSENTMAYLRILEKSFIKFLNQKVCISIATYARKEIFFGKRNENLANSIVDAIKITANVMISK